MRNATKVKDIFENAIPYKKFQNTNTKFQNQNTKYFSLEFHSRMITFRSIFLHIVSDSLLNELSSRNRNRKN